MWNSKEKRFNLRSRYFVKLFLIFSLIALQFNKTLALEDLLTGEATDARNNKNSEISNKIPPFGYQWFEQKLTHFNNADNRTFLQRYFEFNGYFKGEGPIFLNIDGEGSGFPESPVDFISKGSMPQYAKEQGALILNLEHRFYGSSHRDTSMEYLRYLSIDEAIEDIASFIVWYKSIPGFQKSKWVIFGASYAGSLAKWFSQTHPELVDITVISSAPVTIKHEMPEFMKAIDGIINSESSKCAQDLSRGFSCLELTVKGQSCGDHNHSASDLKEMFGLCEVPDFQNEMDLNGFFFTLFNIFSNIVVNNIPNPQSPLSLQKICHDLSNANQTDSETPLENLGRVVKDITTTSGISCIEYRFNKIVEYLTDEAPNSPSVISGDRQFEWQQCTQLGWFKGYNSNTGQPQGIFGERISTALHEEICRKVFHLSQTETKAGIFAANLLNQVRNDMKCGIFVNGKSDPWSALALNDQQIAGNCNKVFNIKGASHVQDKDSIAEQSFPPSLKNAQLQIGKLLEQWLQTGNSEDSNSNTIPSDLNLTFNSTTTTEGPTLQFFNESISIPEIKNNELLAEGSKRHESIALSKFSTNPDKIPIDEEVKFKDVTAFITKHEDQFFTPDADNKRYRLKIRRTDNSQGQTYSKFGIKIRMVEPNGDNTWENEKGDEKLNSQWGSWTDFETRKIMKPKPNLEEIPRTLNVSLSRPFGSTKSRFVRINVVESSSKISNNETDVDKSEKKSLMILTLNGNNTEIPFEVPASTSQRIGNQPISRTNNKRRIRTRKIKRVRQRRRNETLLESRIHTDDIFSQNVEEAKNKFYSLKSPVSTVDLPDALFISSDSSNMNSHEDGPLNLASYNGTLRKRKAKNPKSNSAARNNTITMYLNSGNGTQNSRNEKDRVLIEIIPSKTQNSSTLSTDNRKVLKYDISSSEEDESEPKTSTINGSSYLPPALSRRKTSFSKYLQKSNETTSIEEKSNNNAKDVVIFKSKSTEPERKFRNGKRREGNRLRSRPQNNQYLNLPLQEAVVNEENYSREIVNTPIQKQRTIPQRVRPVSNMFVGSDGRVIPLSDLNWKIGSPGYVDMSSGSTSAKKLSFTQADVAWVTYGIKS